MAFSFLVDIGMFPSGEFSHITKVCSIISRYRFILLSSAIIFFPFAPSKAAQVFNVDRLTHYDAVNSQNSDKSPLISSDIPTLSSRAYARRCIMMSLNEVNVELTRNVIKNSAGRIIILLPSKDWNEDLLEVRFKFLHVISIALIELRILSTQGRIPNSLVFCNGK